MTDKKSPTNKNDRPLIENDIETYLQKKCEANDILYYKFTSPSRRGVPDRILIGNGLTVFVELKRPGKKPRKQQEKVITRMREHGATVFVIDSKEGSDKLMELFS